MMIFLIQTILLHKITPPRKEKQTEGKKESKKKEKAWMRERHRMKERRTKSVKWKERQTEQYEGKKSV